MINFLKKAGAVLLIASASAPSWSQVTTNYDVLGKDQARPITTAVPFLTISPDARSGALGDAGVAIAADANASHWNIAKLAFLEDKIGFAISYTPWLRKLVNDMSLSFITGYYKPTKEQAFSFSLTYFNLGELEFVDNAGKVYNTYRPKEYAPKIAYARKLSSNFSMGLGLKFVYSQLTGSIAGTSDLKAGISGAADIGLFYTKDIEVQGKTSNLSIGLNFSDIGNKITYTTVGQANFIPTNLRLGAAYSIEVDDYNKFTFTVDANKWMVPTPPVYDDNNKIVKGKNPSSIPVLKGIFGSFTDAPDGFREELREITLSAGIEYWYNNLFAARLGTFQENKLKGNRKYLTAGFGVRYQKFGLDFAYLVPFRQNNPLAETLRFSLSYNFEGKKQESVVE